MMRDGKNYSLLGYNTNELKGIKPISSKEFNRLVAKSEIYENNINNNTDNNTKSDNYINNNSEYNKFNMKKLTSVFLNINKKYFRIKL